MKRAVKNILVVAFWVCAGCPLWAGTWMALTRTAPEALNTMLLLPDGTVMAAGASSQNAWYRLTPDTGGSYVNGTWSTLATMRDTRLYYSSAVLTNGRVLVAGAEYGTGTNNAEVYDPLANTWTPTDPPPVGQGMFYDSSAKILANGNVLVTPVTPASYGGAAIYNTALNTWSNGPTLFRGYYQDEASWVKLPDDSILTVDPFGTNSERYIPSLNKWVNDANVPVELYDPYGGEMGAGLLLSDGRAFFIGATSNTVFYAPSGTTNAGVWTAGPTIPNGLAAPDAPAAMMINGNILCVLSPLPVSTNHFPTPTIFFEFDPVANAFTQIVGPTGTNHSSAPYVMRMLDLPDGSVLFSASSSRLYVYRPTGAPLAAGKPTINGVSTNANGSFHLTGVLLNGISEGAAYGDDAQMDSNYPLVRFTNSVTTNVYYGRTFNWNSTSVQASNTVVSAEFVPPSGLPLADYFLVAVANGIASDAVAFPFSNSVPVISLPPQNFTNYAGLSATFTVAAAGAPLTYAWQRNGNPIAGATNSTYTTNNLQLADSGSAFACLVGNANGTTLSVSATLTVLPGLPPAITTQPASLTLSAGNNPTFSLVSASSVPQFYAWQRNTVPIANATNASYTFTNIQAANSGDQFRCVVTNAFGSTTSSNATLTVTPGVPPVITVQPAGTSGAVGGSATFSLTATSAGPTVYFWQRNGASIASATNASYTTNNLQLADSGNVFACLVSNAFGSTMSSNATLLVLPPSLVLNNGFEAGSFASWTTSGNFQFSSVSSSATYVHSGTYGMQTGPSTTLGYISQTIATTAGQKYLLAWWLKNNSSGTPYQFVANWNGSALVNLTTLPAPAWTNFHYLVTATTNSTVLQFGFRHDPSYFGFDDVSLVAVPTPNVNALAKTNGLLTFSWTSLPTANYQVETSTNLAPANWVNLGGVVSAVASSTATTVAVQTNGQQFYRVVLVP